MCTGLVIWFLGRGYVNDHMHKKLLIYFSTWGDLLLGNASTSINHKAFCIQEDRAKQSSTDIDELVPTAFGVTGTVLWWP